jgi:glyoxylase-like metal-dependent hydrolase (beta-lactamase superfamily II)
MTFFRQFFDPKSFAFTYLLADADSRDAVVIDAGHERTTLALLAMLAELDLQLDYVLQTHIHDDALRGAKELKERTGARVVLSETASNSADLQIRHGDTVTFGNEVIDVISTPGHTQGCLSYLWRDRVFTGDALLIGGCGSTDRPGGDPAVLYDSITRRLFVLPGETLVFPGHDRCGRTVSTIAEERERNPVLTGCSRDEFITRRCAR